MSRTEAFDEGTARAPFEVLQQHRLVRIGNRRYPAVTTNAMPEYRVNHALLPTENGNLIAIEHVPGAEQPWAVSDVNEWGLHRDIESVHAKVGEMSRKHLNDKDRETGAVFLRRNVRKNAGDPRWWEDEDT